MNRFLLLILIGFLLSGPARSQIPADSSVIPLTDSVVRKDSTQIIQRVDSFSMRPKMDSGWKMSNQIAIGSPAFSFEVMKHHPFFGFDSKPALAPPSSIRQFRGKEDLFYVILFLFMVFALLKRAFPKYFSDMFRLVFRTTLKQRQVREQLIQTPLPGLLLNIFFILVGGFYIAFLLSHYHINPVGNFWLLALYCALGITAIYFIKFTGLKFSGWLFNMETAAGSYIFIIFIINKMLGIILLPFLLLLAFTTGNIYTSSLTLSWVLIAGLLIYRFILTYGAVRNEVKVNPFHFFLYLLAFEIAPLLLVYKGLLLFFRITA